jgi:hypothetical protein
VRKKLGAALFGALCLFSCKKEATSNPVHSVGERAGIRIDLPNGWAARTTSEERLCAGPKTDAAALCIDRVVGKAAQRPSSKELTAEYLSRFDSIKWRVAHAQDGADSSSVLLEAADSGHTVAVALVAKSARGDLYLCATRPGVDESNVRLALTACGSLEVRSSLTSSGGPKTEAAVQDQTVEADHPQKFPEPVFRL